VIVVGRIGDVVLVLGHPFVDVNRAGPGDVGPSRGHSVKQGAVKGLAIPVIAVGQVGSDVLVGEVIDDLRLVVDDAAQGQGPRSRRGPEAGVPFRSGRLTGLTIGEDDLELARGDGTAIGESPLGQVAGIVIGQEQPGEVHRVAATVIKLQPRFARATAILDTGNVVGLHLVEP